jgi:predicted permease
MSRMRMFGSRLLGLFCRRCDDQSLDTELRAHLDDLTEENIRRGMSLEEARYAARREFGGVEQAKESYREQRGLPVLETLVRDVRVAARGFLRQPAFTCLAILTLALGIGVTTSLFTIVHGVLFSPLPFREPDRLVSLWERNLSDDFPTAYNVVSGGVFDDWQRQSLSFEQMALIGEDSANLSGDDGVLPEAITTRLCSYTLFSMLGVSPVHGRFFSAEDDHPGVSGTVVLTYGLWNRRYAADAAIIGKTILLDAKPYTVIGVLPSWFDYPDARTLLWLPVRYVTSEADMRSRGNHRFYVTARLKAGATAAQAFSELDGIQQRLRKQFPDELIGRSATVIPLAENIIRDVKGSLYLLMGAVSCVLLIACLNVANLFVARSAARGREIAVRAALGASRWRLTREQMTESVVLTLAGGALGGLLAYASVRWLVTFRADLPRANSIYVDKTALLFTMAITVTSGLLAGLLPALSTTRDQFAENLKESSRSLSGGRARVVLRRSPLIAEVALTVTLLIGGGLLLKSFAELRGVRMGCATNNVLTMGLSLPKASYAKPSEKAAFFEQLLARVRSTPGVGAAGFATVVPGRGHWEDNTFRIEGRAALLPGQSLDAVVRAADPLYFAAMGIPLLRGRLFTEAERLERARSLVISESMASKFFPNEDAIGRSLLLDWEGGPRFEIVGIVGDVLSTLDRPPEPTMYFPLSEGRFGYGQLVVRSAMDVTSLALPIQKEIAVMDGDLAVSEVLTMEQIIGKSTANAKFDAALVLLFAALALLLAAVGLYGLLSYLVTQRTSEIGLRIALGAQRSAVLQLMLADGLRPILLGLVLGLIGGAISAQLIRSELFGVKPLDFSVFASVTLVVLVVAMAASLFPAWRASRCDPMVALRCE